MRKPDLRTLQAISALQNNADFSIFFSWVENSYKDLVEVVINDGITLDHTHRVNQGRAMACSQIIKVVKEVDERLKAIANGQK